MGESLFTAPELASFLFFWTPEVTTSKKIHIANHKIDKNLGFVRNNENSKLLITF